MLNRFSLIFTVLVASCIFIGARWPQDNTLEFGDNLDTDKDIVVDNGDANNPTLRYDAGNSEWQLSNDGSSFNAVSTFTELSLDLTPVLGGDLDLTTSFGFTIGASSFLHRSGQDSIFHGINAGTVGPRIFWNG